MSRVVLRDMTEEGLDVHFDVQDDEVAQRVAAFTAPDSDDRDSYLAKLRKIVASNEITKKVIVLEGIRWSASPRWARFRRTPATGGTATRSPMGGEVQRLATAWGTLTAAESRRAIETFLDGYINFAYRSLKSHRDGRTPEAHLDATESIPWALPLVFAVHRRVRHNKYLP